jgi:hypothetical protein
MAEAGEVCPPVPPPEIITRMKLGLDWKGDHSMGKGEAETRAFIDRLRRVA